MIKLFKKDRKKVQKIKDSVEYRMERIAKERYEEKRKIAQAKMNVVRG